MFGLLLTIWLGGVCAYILHDVRNIQSVLRSEENFWGWVSQGTTPENTVRYRALLRDMEFRHLRIVLVAMYIIGALMFPIAVLFRIYLNKKGK